MLIGIIIVAVLVVFFLVKTPVDKNAPQPCATNTSTDCLKKTPIGTSYYVPPKEESSATTTQSGKIDEHLKIDNTLRDVNFCGKMYKVKQVMIDGVDVVQRIAEIANDKYSKGREQDVLQANAICGNIEFSITRQNNTSQTPTLNELKIYGPSIQNTSSEKIIYLFGIGGVLGFNIDYPSFQIKISKAEEGETTIIGTLK